MPGRLGETPNAWGRGRLPGTPGGLLRLTSPVERRQPMISTLPKLRSDLDRRVQTTPNGSVLMIKDPVSGEFFRLQEAERFIAEQLDGTTPLNILNTRVEKKFGASLAPEKLAAFIKTLDRNRLLETQTNGHKARPKQPGR